MFKTIRARLTLWYVALLALILVGFSGALYVTLARALYQQTDTSLAFKASQLANAVDIVNGRMDYPGKDKDTSDFDAARARGDLVRLLNADGTILNTNPTYAPLPIAPDSFAVAQRGAAQFETVSLNGENYRLYTTPVQDHGKTIGALQMAERLGEIHRALRELAFTLALSVPLTLAAATAGGIFLARRALTPMDRITRAVQRLNAQDLRQRLNLNLPDDEVGRLAQTFDVMLDRLENAFQREREFTANASHELRTPLTVMRGGIDVALERPRTADEYQRVLGELGAQADQLTRLAQDLLTLAYADARQIGVTREELNAAQILGAVADALEPIATAKEIGIQIQADESLAFWGDEQKLLRVLFNLVENALNYSKAGDVVLLSARAAVDSITLAVTDHGAGIAPEDLPHLFERFYRGQNGREQGAGLGLAIARALVQAQGGTIRVSSPARQGTTFTVQLPMRNL